MRKYTLEELIKFCDEEIAVMKKLEDYLGSAENDYIAKMQAVAEELWRLKDLSE